MHKWALTYTVSKPFPYPWLTWLVLFGGIAATAIFSVISIAANGFDTALVTVANPNETETPSSAAWYQKQPWALASKVSPKCQDQVFTVGSNVYTSSLGYSHLLQSIYELKSAAIPLVRSSLAYHHSGLEDCALMRLTVAAWPEGFNASYLSVCTVYDNFVPISIELWTYTDATSITGIVYGGTLWPSWFVWANLLMWSEQALIFEQLTALGNNNTWTARCDYFFPDRTRPASARRVLSTATVTYQNTSFNARIGNHWFLDIEPRSWPSTSLSEYSNVTLENWATTPGSAALSFFDSFTNGDTTSYPQPWNTSSPLISLALRADNLVRLLYSFMMSDLGQPSSTNILSDPQALFNYTDAVAAMDTESNINTSTSTSGLMSNAAGLLGFNTTDQIFQFNQSTRSNPSSLFSWANTSVPLIAPSYLNTLYLCQVPKMKPVASLIFAVIIADLVFLQTLWTVFGFIMKSVLEQKDETANYCMGCSQRMTRSGDETHYTPVNGSGAGDRSTSVRGLDQRLSDDSGLRARNSEKTKGFAVEREVFGSDPVARNQPLDDNERVKGPDETITLLSDSRSNR